MKRAELLFNFLAIPLDAAMILVSAVFAYFLRIRFGNIRPILFDIQPLDYLQTILLILPFLLAMFAFYGLYNLRSTHKLGYELSRIVAAVTTVLMIVVLIFFFDRDVFPSRLIVLLSWGITIVFVSVGRIILRFIRDGQLRRGRGAHRLVVITGTKTDQKIIDNLKTNPELGYRVTEVISAGSPDLFEKLEKLSQSGEIDELLQADPELDSKTGAKLVRFCHDRGVKFNFVPDVFNVSTTRVEIEILGGAPIIKLKGTPLDGWGRVAKRLADITISLLALVILSPFIFVIALLIRLDSRGPIIYKAPRYGLATAFTFYKFRSMHAHLSVGQDYGGEEAEQLRQELAKMSTRNGPLKKIPNDPRVTRMGRIIRKLKLDEIPQLWNVLRGDMSLVGPRAHVLDEVEEYREQYKYLFTVKPGITGLTQIAQLQKPDLPFEEEVRIDTYYIQNWSLRLDVKIIFRTWWMLVSGKFAGDNY